MAKITKRSVDAAAPSEREYFIWDEELGGFGLRVYPSGRKMYLAQFRAGGRVRRYNIGTHGTITPEVARTEAMKHLSSVRLGGDPARERDRQKASPTMKEFGERFLKEHVAVHCKPTTAAEYKRSVELFINPKLGSFRIIDVTRADVVELHRSLKDTPYQANRNPRRAVDHVHPRRSLGSTHRRGEPLLEGEALQRSEARALPHR